jgi:hypothetical protein
MKALGEEGECLLFDSPGFGVPRPLSFAPEFGLLERSEDVGGEGVGVAEADSERFDCHCQGPEGGDQGVEVVDRELFRIFAEAIEIELATAGHGGDLFKDFGEARSERCDDRAETEGVKGAF